MTQPNQNQPAPVMPPPQLPEAPPPSGVTFDSHTEGLLDDLGVVEDPLAPGENMDSARVPLRDEGGRFAPKPKPSEVEQQLAPEQQAQAPQPSTTQGQEPPTPPSTTQSQEPAQPEGEVDWRARAMAAEEQLNRSRSGFQRTIQELRQGMRAQYMPPVHEPQQPLDQRQYQMPPPQQQQVPEHIPIEFNQQGQPVIPRSALEQLLAARQPQQAPPNPATVRRFGLDRFQQMMVMRDPVSYAPAVNRVMGAIEMADQLVLAKQQELGGYQFRSPDQLLDFMETVGISETLRQTYPDLLADDVGIESLIEGSLTLNPRKLERLVERARNSSPATPPGVAPVQQRAPAPVTQLRPLPANRPRSQAVRGTPAPPTTDREARMAYLESRDPMSWTPEEAKEFELYTRQGIGRAG